VRDLSPAGQRPDRRRRRRDLCAGPIPAAALEQWRDTEAALTQLYRSVSDDMAALMRQETAEWVLDLQSNLLRLEASTGDPGRPAGAGRAGSSLGWAGPRTPPPEETRDPCPPTTDRSWRRCASGSPTRRSSFDLAGKERELTTLREQAAAPNLWDDPERARRVMSRLAAVEGDIDTVARLQGQLEDLETLNQLALEEDDDSVAAELTQGLATLTAAVEDLEVLALLGGEFDDRDAIVTIHPGAGGTESQDWAEMLWRMLQRWAERRGFKVTVNDYQEGDEAGIKSVTMTLEGPRAYGLVSTEAGTHRLVRLSPFDQAKRRHTSFAAVDAIPVLEDEDTPEIDDADLRIDVYRSSGPGGQGVNTTDSAVRVTHLPTGIVVAVQNERSQLANKTIALKILGARLAERARKEREAQLAALRGDRGDIAFGSQIRSYVLHPYQMVKDHRTGLETGNVQAVLDGDLDQFVAAELRRRATDHGDR
jgi:peptide chain release factor 2